MRAAPPLWTSQQRWAYSTSWWGTWLVDSRCLRPVKHKRCNQNEAQVVQSQIESCDNSRHSTVDNKHSQVKMVKKYNNKNSHVPIFRNSSSLNASAATRQKALKKSPKSALNTVRPRIQIIKTQVWFTAIIHAPPYGWTGFGEKEGEVKNVERSGKVHRQNSWQQTKHVKLYSDLLQALNR